MAEEYEEFKITDYDLENEFNINRPYRKLTKNQQIYGELDPHIQVVLFIHLK